VMLSPDESVSVEMMVDIVASLTCKQKHTFTVYATAILLLLVTVKPARKMHMHLQLTQYMIILYI